LILLLLAMAGAAAAPADEFNACIAKLRSEALAKGVAAQTFDTAMAGVEPDSAVLEALNYQPEFVAPIWDYFAGLVDDRRIADGRAMLAQWAPVLARAEQSLGVDRHVLVAIWGVETDYGRVMGGRPLVRSLATVSCFGHRQRFFRGELVAALRIVQSGDVASESLKGSWAGAFGQTQFMPSTFHRLAIDFDGDGRRDIVGSVADALGSTANFLSRAGWVASEPWGFEVTLPPGYAGPSGRRNRQPLARWAQNGIRRADGAPLTGSGLAALLLPAGAGGPAFLVQKNFDALFSYNAAESYALAIAHLSDRLRGEGPFRAPWPTDDPGLSRAERREVQQRLVERGFDIGEPDGVIGARTRAAIESFQAAAGLPVDGRAGMRVLEALRRSNPSAAPPAKP
jgi:lytic murein transglycosylase